MLTHDSTRPHQAYSSFAWVDVCHHPGAAVTGRRLKTVNIQFDWFATHNDRLAYNDMPVVNIWYISIQAHGNLFPCILYLSIINLSC